MKFALVTIVFCVAFVSAQTFVNVEELGFKGTYSFNTNISSTVLFIIPFNNETFGNNLLNAYAQADPGLNATVYTDTTIAVSYCVSTNPYPPLPSCYVVVELDSDGSAVICQNYSYIGSGTATGYTYVSLNYFGDDTTGVSQDFDIEVQINLFDTCSIDNFDVTDNWNWISAFWSYF